MNIIIMGRYSKYLIKSFAFNIETFLNNSAMEFSETKLNVVKIVYQFINFVDKSSSSFNRIKCILISLSSLYFYVHYNHRPAFAY